MSKIGANSHQMKITYSTKITMHDQNYIPSPNAYFHSSHSCAPLLVQSYQTHPAHVKQKRCVMTKLIDQKERKLQC